MPDDIDVHLGRRLRRRRQILGLTQTELAQLVGVRFQQIQKYECGANRISAARLWSIAHALKTPIAYFYDGARTGPRSLGQKGDTSPISARPDASAAPAHVAPALGENEHCR